MHWRVLGMTFCCGVSGNSTFETISDPLVHSGMVLSLSSHNSAKRSSNVPCSRKLSIPRGVCAPVVGCIHLPGATHHSSSTGRAACLFLVVVGCLLLMTIRLCGVGTPMRDVRVNGTRYKLLVCLPLVS